MHDAAQQAHLTLWTDPSYPTRISNSVARDSNPDLTYTHNIPRATWTRLDETLGSDHYIIEFAINHTRIPKKSAMLNSQTENPFVTPLSPPQLKTLKHGPKISSKLSKPTPTP